jgi:hypothetical protein
MQSTNFRNLIKRTNTTGEVPTIPVSNDHTDGTWISTDIYSGEFFINTADAKAWYRAGAVIKEIDVAAVTALTDLSDVSMVGSPAPTNGQVLTYNSTSGKWENADNNALVSITDITYANLVIAIGAATLVPGNFYRLTDYRTIHQIPDTSTINTCALEPLVLLATGTQSIATRVWSASYTYDHIEYNWALDLAEDGTTPRPGFITYRKDYQDNIAAWCDWRGYLLRRYALIQDNSYNWDSGSTYAVGDLVQYTTNNYLYFCYNTVSVAGTNPLTDDKHWIKVADLSSLIYQFTVGQKIGNTTIINDSSYADVNIFNGGVINATLGPGSNDNVFFGDTTEVEIGTNCVKNSFYGTTAIIKMGYGCTANFVNASVSLTLGNNCNYNVLSDGANNCTFGSASVSNVIGIGSTYNVFSTGCLRNYLANSSLHNKFGDSCTDNSLNVGCYENILGNICSYNKFNIGCYLNILDSYNVQIQFNEYCFNNTLGTSCSNNIFDGSCSFNIFGASCLNNTFGTACLNNTFTAYSSDNTLGNACQYNTFGNFCFNNIFGNNCNSNSFQNNCFNNTAGDNFDNNFINVGINRNIFGTSCAYNIFYNVSNIDFTSATHVKNPYTCELFTRVDGTAKLKYVNNSDVQLIVNATA